MLDYICLDMSMKYQNRIPFQFVLYFISVLLLHHICKVESVDST